MRALLTVTGSLLAGFGTLVTAAGLAAISVQEPQKGTFQVEARFHTAASAAAVRTVLTDYANIPRFMPDVRTSEVVGRSEGVTTVRQEAVSQYLFFSKRVSLLLAIDESDTGIRFRDRSGSSFHLYEGAWTIIPRDDGAEVTYVLTARPAFSVPAFVIRKLLDRDARQMIDRLQIAFTTPSAPER